MKNKKTIIVIILLLLTFVSPLLGVVTGCLLMWFWTKWAKWVKIVITLIFLLPVFFLLTYVFFFRAFKMSGDDMNPTFKAKEYVMSNLISLRFALPTRGDIVVFVAPPDPNKDLIKRIIGVAGDTVALKNGNVYINGQLLDERSYLNADVKTYGGSFLNDDQGITVPQDEYFVLGDNRKQSYDSRAWGLLPRKNIIGKVSFCYWNCH